MRKSQHIVQHYYRGLRETTRAAPLTQPLPCMDSLPLAKVLTPLPLLPILLTDGGVGRGRKVTKIFRVHFEHDLIVA